jgi:hypothetical protein
MHVDANKKKNDKRSTRTLQAAQNAISFIIPSEAGNLSFFSWAQIEERFLASLGMTKVVRDFFQNLALA